MRKSVLVATVLLCAPFGSAWAAGTMETGPGCGLGAMLWADSAAKKHIVQQALIATTNGTGMQTFAISSGTSGCTNDGVIVQNEKVNVFAGINFAPAATASCVIRDDESPISSPLISRAVIQGMSPPQYAATAFDGVPPDEISAISERRIHPFVRQAARSSRRLPSAPPAATPPARRLDLTTKLILCWVVIPAITQSVAERALTVHRPAPAPPGLSRLQG